MFGVGTLGPGFTSKGKEPLRVQGAGLLGVPGALGVDSSPGRNLVLREGKQAGLHLQAPPWLGEGKEEEQKLSQEGEKAFFTLLGGEGCPEGPAGWHAGRNPSGSQLPHISNCKFRTRAQLMAAHPQWLHTQQPKINEGLNLGITSSASLDKPPNPCLEP